MKNLEKSLEEFAGELDKAFKKGELAGYALIGGLAVSARSKPRATKDIDFLVSAEKDFFSKTFPEILESKGHSYKIFKGGWDDPVNGLIRVYDEDGSELVDIIPVFWKWQDEIVKNAEKLKVFEGVSIPVARIEDLVILKLVAGGPQDMLDIEELLKVGKVQQNIDKERLLNLAKRAKESRKLKELLNKFDI